MEGQVTWIYTEIVWHPQLAGTIYSDCMATMTFICSVFTLHSISGPGSKPKKLFSYFKSIRKDNSGISPLKKEGILYTDTVEKTNILNQQFQSVFTHDPPHDIHCNGQRT